jgi:small-conductance mechanosensitive channel
MISATFHGAARDMDEETTSIAGWVAGVFGLLLALVAWGREVFKHRHERALKSDETTAKKEEKNLDVTSDLAKSMLARIANLESREDTARKEATQREDTLRVRLDAVEAEADECQKSQAVLREQHRVTLEEVCDLREENTMLRARIATVEGQNQALNTELNGLYRSIGVKRQTLPAPKALPPPVRQDTVEVIEIVEVTTRKKE